FSVVFLQTAEKSIIFRQPKAVWPRIGHFFGQMSKKTQFRRKINDISAAWLKMSGKAPVFRLRNLIDLPIRTGFCYFLSETVFRQSSMMILCDWNYWLSSKTGYLCMRRINCYETRSQSKKNYHFRSGFSGSPSGGSISDLLDGRQANGRCIACNRRL
ncbi:MAG: hypothetical protein KBS67_05310, partial [Bacteroidales bacterium]|nr:hypothetical protein [Candidatus Cryptobacteroides equifaecalis]